MVKPLTKLAPWRSAERTTHGRAAAPPAGAGRIPPAARGSYPITAPTNTATHTPVPSASTRPAISIALHTSGVARPADLSGRHRRS